MHLKIKLSSMQGSYDLRKEEGDILQLTAAVLLESCDSIACCSTNCLTN